jgi:hypothetical protein
MQGSSIVKIDVQASSGVCLAMPSAEPHGLIDETNCNLPRLGACMGYTLYDAPPYRGASHYREKKATKLILGTFYTTFAEQDPV